MFKPAYVLQVALIAGLVGCTTTHQNHDTAHAATPTSDATHGTRAPATQKSLPSNPSHQQSIAENPHTDNLGTFVDSNSQLFPELQAYAQEVAQTHRIPLDHVESVLKQANYNARVAELMSPAKTRVRRSWSTYRQRFVDPARINAGVRFWQEHQAELDEISSQYGVPASIIVAILGVETNYGHYMGNFSVLDALTTLAFRYPDPDRPDRVQLFRDQLADLILLDYNRELDARTATGSYAGAMGLPQFMPGSLVRYAVDGDGDGRVDLQTNTADAMASIANFMRKHGWQPGLPVFAPVTLPANAKQLVKGGLEPTYDWTQLETHGAVEQAGNHTQDWKRYKLGIVDLVDEPRKLAEYRSGTPNFFAITHYNRSYFYATSVAELAQALSERMGYD